MAVAPEIYHHKEWLGLIQPVGLVVSPPALVKSQAFIERQRAIELQQRLQALVSSEETTHLKDFRAFVEQVLEWAPEDLVEPEELPIDLEVVLPDYGETLRPSYAMRAPDSATWLMLIQVHPRGLLLDEVAPSSQKGHGWKVTVQAKFERLLRETETPIGLLFNGVELRLVYAPRGESSGHLTFPVAAMTEVSGRLILGALDMLLGVDRLFNVPTDRRLAKILSDSRDYQAEVSTKLASQVLDALWELLRGFQAADDLVNGRLLRELAKDEPQHIYGGLITILMRLVFLLYAEDEGLMPDDALYQRNYAVSGLYERLVKDSGSYPDTMDQRFGAWNWLLSLFRLVYEGGGHVANYLPARHGQLFAPDEYPFLEGRSRGSHFQRGQWLDLPRISDDTVYFILDNLLMLDGEKLSYRSLDVEQIGSVYEAIMGFDVLMAEGLSIALRPFDLVVDVERVLAAKPSERTKILQDEAECKLSSKECLGVQEAMRVEDLLAAIERKLSPRTPNLLPVGSLFLQPGEERRRTGSHYTPRRLTQPIVEMTLGPVLDGLGVCPTVEQILGLKVCDLAMGSGAFLVETCRQLAQRVVEAWRRQEGEGRRQEGDEENEDLLLAARRLVAQRCLYGVDKNPFAVNLAKLSLWLVTLARDKPFTFVDHALKCGDSLVGLSRSQIGCFTWVPQKEGAALGGIFKDYQVGFEVAEAKRNELSRLTDEEYERKFELNKEADLALGEGKWGGDLIVGAFFAADNKRGREEKLAEFRLLDPFSQFPPTPQLPISPPLPHNNLCVHSSLLRGGSFHWEIEFPEVFDRENPGFDAVVGNPPFMGKNTTINANAEGYLDWLKVVHPESHGNADLVAHFFRRAFNLVRKNGTLGLIATNTIAQGDTRSSGLRFICNNGGVIYNAIKRYKWPGLAAVVVSVVNIYKGQYEGVKLLDNQPVPLISAFLFHAGGNDDPRVLLANAGKSFQGSIVLGMGFTFDDSNPDATSLVEMQRLIEDNPKNQECIFPYIGGEEVNSSPSHCHHRYVINFGEMSEDEAREYPDLMRIVEEKVKPERLAQKDKGGQEKWWQFLRPRGELKEAIKPLDRVLVTACGATKYFAPAFLPSNCVFSHALAVFTFEQYSNFAILQSRIHEIWVRFLGSSLEDRLRYTPSDCFETFPFPLEDPPLGDTPQPILDPPQPPLLRGESEDPPQPPLLRGESDEESELGSGSPLYQGGVRGGSHSSYQGGVRGGSHSSSPTYQGEVRGGSSLEQIGKNYYEFRAEIMVKNNQGLTETYNRFHAPDEYDSDILKLRELHEQMDRAVLDAYGWQDIDTTCGFALDYLDTGEEEIRPVVQERIASGDLFFPTLKEALAFDLVARTGRRKLPWRYRWSQKTHDEVLARLLDLNQKRAEEEILSGKTAEKKEKGKGSKKPKSQKTTKVDEGQMGLFPNPNT